MEAINSRNFNLNKELAICLSELENGTTEGELVLGRKTYKYSIRKYIFGVAIELWNKKAKSRYDADAEIKSIFVKNDVMLTKEIFENFNEISKAQEIMNKFNHIFVK